MSFPLPMDPNEVSRVAPSLPAGAYRVRIAGPADGAEAPIITYTNPRDPSKSPSPYVKMTLLIQETPDGSGTVIASNTGEEMSCVDKKLFDSLFLTNSEGAMRRVRLFLESFGIKLPLGDDGNPSLPTDDDNATISDWVGLTGVVQARLGKPNQNGQRYLEVANYVPADEA